MLFCTFPHEQTNCQIPHQIYVVVSNVNKLRGFDIVYVTLTVATKHFFVKYYLYNTERFRILEQIERSFQNKSKMPVLKIKLT